MPKLCKNYKTKKHPISEECNHRKGIYKDNEIAGNFWKEKSNSDGYWTICKHCKRVERNEVTTAEPTLTKDWPRDENGGLLCYWHIIEKDIILKVSE